MTLFLAGFIVGMIFGVVGIVCCIALLSASKKRKKR